MRRKVELLCMSLLVVLTPIVLFYLLSPSDVKAEIDAYDTVPCIIIGVIVIVLAVRAVQEERR